MFEDILNNYTCTSAGITPGCNYPQQVQVLIAFKFFFQLQFKVYIKVQYNLVLRCKFCHYAFHNKSKEIPNREIFFLMKFVTLHGVLFFLILAGFLPLKRSFTSGLVCKVTADDKWCIMQRGILNRNPSSTNAAGTQIFKFYGLLWNSSIDSLLYGWFSTAVSLSIVVKAIKIFIVANNEL